MRVAGHRHIGMPLRLLQAGERNLLIEFGEVEQTVLQIESRGHRHLVIAAAPGMDLGAQFAGPLGQEHLDGGVAIFEALVQHKPPALKLLQQLFQQGDQAPALVLGQYPDARQAAHMRRRRADIVGEELPIEQDVFPSQELHDDLIHGGTPIRLPQVTLQFWPPSRASNPARASRPKARFRFCTA